MAGAMALIALLTRLTAAEPLQPVPFTDVTVTGSFWKTRLETNRSGTIPYNFKKCEELGLTANFARSYDQNPSYCVLPHAQRLEGETNCRAKEQN